GRPQVQQHGAAAPVRELARFAGTVGEGKIGQARGLLDHVHRRDFASGERGKLGGELRRLLAGRVSRIALERADPVYRRERQRARRNAADDQRDEAAMSGLFRGKRIRVGHGNLRVMSNKMWGGRFASGPDAIMEEINASIDFDRRLYRQDIAASKAHAAMLAKQGIIAREDAKKIAHGLDTILSEIESGKFNFKQALEDIHMNVEGRLAELVGSAAGRLHTARSRNDQVATDFKLWVRDAIDMLDAA